MNGSGIVALFKQRTMMKQSGALMNFMMALPLIRMWRWVVMFCTRASASSVSE